MNLYAVGDTVLIHEYRTWGPDIYHRSTIKRITPTGRIVATLGTVDVAFKPNGREIGSGYKELEPFDQSKLDIQTRQFRMLRLRRQLSDTKWSDVPDGTVELIVSLLQAGKVEASV